MSKLNKESHVDYFYAISGSQKGLYKYFQESMDLFMPKISSKCITDEYLEKVLKAQVLTFKISQIKTPKFLKCCTKQELTTEIIKILDAFNSGKQASEQITLGFDETNTADKEWLKTALFKLSPNHEFFKRDKQLIDQELLSKLTKK